MRLLNAYVDWLSVALEKWTVELREATAAIPERAYWRGYEDGWRDQEERTTPL